MSFKQFEKRNKTLLVEYKNQFKSNSFNDKRIGENDQNMSLEDKMFKRFVAERKKGKDKKNRFNLNDDEEADPFGTELTHGGQSLAQIENFERVELSDDEKIDPEDPERGKISAEFVSENFFGGFKASDRESKQMNRKEWIDEMILKSKQLKYERQKERDKTLDLTEELDKEWRQIQPLINTMVNRNKKTQDALDEEEFKNPTKPDDYDVYVKSLMFDTKATPTDKLKTDEQIEQERLELEAKIENDSRHRMENELDEEQDDQNESSAAKKKRRGDNDDDAKKRTLLKPGLRKLPSNHRSADDMDFDDAEYTQVKIRDELAHKHKELREENERNELEERNKKSSSEAGNKQLDDFAEEIESNDESESEASHKSEEPNTEFQNEKWIQHFESICSKLNKKLIDLKTFENSIRALMVHLDPSKNEKNKARLCLLTEHLIEYYQSLFNIKSVENSIDMKVVNRCTSFIYELVSKYGAKSTKENPSIFLTLFRKRLGDLNSQYMSLKWNEKKFPQLKTLFLFKLISILFPTSDLRHQLTTPCLLMMTRYLTECSVQSVSECFRGLFLTNLCYEFVSKSKRFIPECIQYLNGILYLAIDWKKTPKLKQYELSTIYEAFKITKMNLVVNENTNQLSPISLSQMSVLNSTKINAKTISSFVAYAIDIITSFTVIYQDNSSFQEIFSITDILLAQLSQSNYPIDLKSRIEKLKCLIKDKSNQPREHLKCLDKKPIASKLFEPKIQAKSKFDPRHHNSVMSEKQLLAKKYKKEHKAAIKEVRLDNQFLARVQLKDQLEKDAKRAQKVKEIMGSLATQEGEYQKIKRMKSN